MAGKPKGEKPRPFTLAIRHSADEGKAYKKAAKKEAPSAWARRILNAAVGIATEL